MSHNASADAAQSKPPATSPNGGWKKFSLLLSALVVALAAFAGKLLLDRNRAGDEASDDHRNVVLLSQQLQSISDQSFRDANSQFTADELRTWLMFDDRFVEQNRSSPLYRFEAATAARRAGIVERALGNSQGALEYFSVADELLEKVIAENPKSYFYQIERGALFLQLAHLYASANDLENARSILNQGVQQLPLDAATATADRDEGMIFLLFEFATLAHKLGDKDQAAVLARQHQELLERAHEAHAGEPGFDQLREQSQNFLESLGS